jgi:hypothetical protein
METFAERLAKLTKNVVLGESTSFVAPEESTNAGRAEAERNDAEAGGIPEARGTSEAGGIEAEAGGIPEAGGTEAQGTAESDHSEESFSDAGKRGRHRRNCSCENCQARREGRTPEKRARAASDVSPGKVDFSLLFGPGFLREGVKPKLEDTAAGFILLLFRATAFAMSEEHWNLANDEAKTIGRQLLACVNTIPAAKRAKIVERGEAVLPWAALSLTALVTVGPRYAMHRAIKSGALQYVPVAASPFTESAPAGATPSGVTPEQTISRSGSGSSAVTPPALAYDPNVKRESPPKRFGKPMS